MKFFNIFIASALGACLLYYSAVLLLIDAPLPAEYWVGEMITIKKDLAKQYAGMQKIVVAGGSSTLFGINAESASKQLGMPVINFGLHAGLRVDKIFEEAGLVVEKGDFMILPLEPPYYDCNEKLDSWQVRNIIGWDRNTWREMNLYEKIEFLPLVSPATFSKMALAQMQKIFYPSMVSDRLRTLDDLIVLSKFRNRTSPAAFEYSAYNIDNHGDMLKTEGAQFKNAGWDVRKPDHVCASTKNKLLKFVKKMKNKGVSVFFANTPFVASDAAKDEVRKSELGFLNEFVAIGCFIDKREDLLFDRKYFFNSNLHLNAEGRAIRTELFIKSIRNSVFLNNCDQPFSS